MSVVFSALKTIATLGPLALAFIRWYRELSQEQKGQFIAQSHLVFSKLKESKTKEARVESAKQIQDLILKL